MKESALHVVLRFRGGAQSFVKTGLGMATTLDVEASTTYACATVASILVLCRESCLWEYPHACPKFNQ
eukprot:7760515-Karenia_brevis.AAC.1